MSGETVADSGGVNGALIALLVIGALSAAYLWNENKSLKEELLETEENGDERRMKDAKDAKEQADKNLEMHQEIVHDFDEQLNELQQAIAEADRLERQANARGDEAEVALQQSMNALLKAQSDTVSAKSNKISLEGVRASKQLAITANDANIAALQTKLSQVNAMYDQLKINKQAAIARGDDAEAARIAAEQAASQIDKNAIENSIDSIKAKTIALKAATATVNDELYKLQSGDTFTLSAPTLAPSTSVTTSTGSGSGGSTISQPGSITIISAFESGF